MKTKYKRTSDKGLSAQVPVLLCSYVLMLFCSSALCSASDQTEGSAIKAVLDLLKSGDPQMQAAAITMARELPGKETTEALAAELPNLSASGQIQLLSALADRCDQAALPAVISSTKSKEGSIRVAALKAIGQLGDASSVTLLAQTAANSIGEEQKAARESLYRLRSPEIDKEILARILSAEPKVKVELIRSIGQRNITAGLDTLLKTAQDTDRHIQLESLKALKIIANEIQIPALVKLLMNIENESIRSEAENTIAAVARKSDDKNRSSALVLAALPTIEDSRGRCSLLRVLGRIGNDNALPALLTALNSNDETIQDTAVRVLSDWPNPTAISDLLSIAKTTKKQTHKILALRGFLRLIELEDNRPAEEAIKIYKQAMELSDGVSEKRLVLSGLAKVKSLSALEITASYLSDAQLLPEAEASVVKIAENIYASYPQQTKDVLNKIIQSSKNETLRQKAQEIIKTTDEGR